MVNSSYEIIAMVHKDYGQKVLEKMHDYDGVENIIVSYGRSSDLFDDKQFGEFGESAYVTILTDGKNKDCTRQGPNFCAVSKKRNQQAKSCASASHANPPCIPANGRRDGV